MHLLLLSILSSGAAELAVPQAPPHSSKWITSERRAHGTVSKMSPKRVWKREDSGGRQ